MWIWGSGKWWQRRGNFVNWWLLDDKSPLFYYQLQNVSKTADEPINDFLINENETVSDKIYNYCQESSSDDEDKIDNLAYSKNKTDAFKEALFNPKDLTEDSLFYIICYVLKQRKTKQKKDLCSANDLKNESDLNLYNKLVENKEYSKLDLDPANIGRSWYLINENLMKFNYFLRILELKDKLRYLTNKCSTKTT